MKPAPFDYISPGSIDETLATLAQHGYDAKILAGGQSLVPSMNFRLTQPAVLVDVNHIPTLAGIQTTANGGLKIGAMTRQRTIERDARIAQYAPLLAEVMPHIAHPQIRNRGTIGGSLAHADPAAELPVVAVALDAKIEIRRQGSTRTVAASDFFQGVFMADVEPEELVTHIEFPKWEANNGFAFLEMARRHGDFALVGVAVVVGLDEGGKCRHIKLIYLNVGETPISATQAAQSLIGNPLSNRAIEHAAQHAAQHEIDPIGNIHASVPYQRHLATVLTRRALKLAHQRANGGSA